MPHNYTLSTTDTPKVAIIGAGTMGLFFAASLRRAGCDVSVVARRREAIDTINGRGITVEEGERSDKFRDISAFAGLADAPAPDLVLVLVKGPDTGEAMAAAAPHIGPGCSVLTIQNGLGNVAVISEYVPRESILGAVCYNGLTFVADGHVRVAGRGITYLGEIFGKNSPRVLALARIFERAGIRSSVVENVIGIAWDKLLVNVGLNALAALTRVKNGELADNPEARALMGVLVAEGAELAERLGITLEEKDPVAHCLEVARNTGDNIASMLQDVLQGKKTEIDSINGMLLLKGREIGLELPMNKTITLLVRLLERSYLKNG